MGFIYKIQIEVFRYCRTPYIPEKSSILNSCKMYTIESADAMISLYKVFKFCVAHLPVKREIRAKFNFGHVCPK